MELNYLHLQKEYDQINDKLSQTTDRQELAKLGKRQSELLPVVTKINRLEKVKSEIAEHEKLIAEKSELSEMPQPDLPSLQYAQEKLLEEIRVFMLSKQSSDSSAI